MKLESITIREPKHSRTIRFNSIKIREKNMTDPIADMLTRIRNVLIIKKDELLIPFSKIKYSLAKVLEKEGFIDKTEKVVLQKKKNFPEIKITLKKNDSGDLIIRGLKRISKPSLRVYLGSRDFKIDNYRILIVSTNRGLMTAEEAKKRKLGGEVLCEVR